MFRLTERRKATALEILDRYTRLLHDNRYFSSSRLEAELRSVWDMGYQELKDVMVDIVENHSEFAHLGAYYMEHSNPMGVVTEFQETLANLYGLEYWYDDEKVLNRKRYWDNVFVMISSFDLSEQINGHSIIQIASLLNQQLLTRILKSPSEMRLMDPRAFEELIAEMLDAFGFSVELTTRTRDGGRDIIAIKSEHLASCRYLVECKRYAEKNKIGIQPVRSLHGVIQDERATKGILVTTSSFTKPATEHLERNKWQLEGKGFDDVKQWLRNYQKIRFPNAKLM